MLKRPIASESLYQFTDSQLLRMWLHAEIDRCPICKRYHDKNGMTKFMQNITKCEDCKEKEKQELDNGMSIINEWLKEK